MRIGTFALRAPAIPAVGVATVALAACGGADKSQEISVEVKQTGPKRFELTAPKSAEAGLTKITLKASGKEPSDMQLVRVEGKHSQAQTLKALDQVMEDEGKGLAPWIRADGGVGVTNPKSTSSAEVILQPGTYYLIDDFSGDGENAPSHYREGAVAMLNVTGEIKSAALPKQAAKITTREYSFQTSGLKAGRNGVRIDNAGGEPHHVIAAPITAGKTLADVKKFAQSEKQPSGPPPVNFDAATSSAVQDGGHSQVAELDFKKPGRYALLCFVNDREGGPPHVVKGMVGEVEIK